MRLHIRTLGQSAVVVENRAVVWPTQATEDLFFLLLSQERGHTKPELVGRLWDSPLTRATGEHLKVTLHRLRRALGDPDAVADAGGRYSLTPVYREHADHHLFWAALARVRGAGDREAQLHHAYQALSLYLGDFLPEQTAEWAQETRDALRAAYVRLRLDVAARHCEAVECHAGVRNLAAGLAADALVGEPYHRALMTCLCTLGRPDDATLHYRHFLRFLQRDIGDTPSRETLRLAEQIKNGEPHPARRIGEALPCPRRLLYGAPGAEWPRGRPPDLTYWDEELRRARQMRTLVQRLMRARDWAGLAQTVQAFLAGQLGTPYIWLAPHDAAAPGGRAPWSGLATLGWPEAALRALRAALGEAPVGDPLGPPPAKDAGADAPTTMNATVEAVQDARHHPQAWLCVVRPPGAAGTAGETEVQARVVDALGYVLSQERWQRVSPSPAEAGHRAQERP